MSYPLSILVDIISHRRQDNLKEDFVEYTKCESCQQALLYCDCNCPFCGKREECECEMRALSITL